jgi:outer membrane protein assembly factor BamB
VRRFWGALGVLAVVAGLSGCWLQPGFDAGRSGWNDGEHTITAANVDQLTELWDVDIAGVGGLGAVVSTGGKVYTIKGTVVSARRADTGAEVWQRDLPLEPPAESRSLSGPVIFQNRLLVGAEDWALSFPSGQVYDLSVSTGAIVGSSASGPASDLAVADGLLVRQSIAKVSSLGDYVVWLDWKYQPAMPAGVGLGQPGRFAIVGDRVAWSTGTDALGYDTTCPPASSGDLCPPVWRTALATAPVDIAAVGTTHVAYSDSAGTVSVLDAPTGAVSWTADAGSGVSRLAVAGGTIFASTVDNRLIALPAAGCGAPTCGPLWEATLAGPGLDPVIGGDVVYVPAGGDIAAFAVAGCGTATCEPLTVLDAERDLSGLIVDEGRVVASSADGHLVAFGLPT